MPIDRYGQYIREEDEPQYPRPTPVSPPITPTNYTPNIANDPPYRPSPGSYSYRRSSNGAWWKTGGAIIGVLFLIGLCSQPKNKGTESQSSTQQAQAAGDPADVVRNYVSLCNNGDYASAYSQFSESMKRQSSRHSSLDEYYQKVFRHQKGMELLGIDQNVVNGSTSAVTIRIKVLPANNSPAEYYTVYVTLVAENGYWKIDEWKA